MKVKIRKKIKKISKPTDVTENVNLEGDNNQIRVEEKVEEDGKIIFLNKKITPLWLIRELSHRLLYNKDKNSCRHNFIL